MRVTKSILHASIFLAVGGGTAQADVNVVASIKPVHSLVAAVMDGVGVFPVHVADCLAASVNTHCIQDVFLPRRKDSLNGWERATCD